MPAASVCCFPACTVLLKGPDADVSNPSRGVAASTGSIAADRASCGDPVCRVHCSVPVHSGRGAYQRMPEARTALPSAAQAAALWTARAVVRVAAASAGPGARQTMIARPVRSSGACARPAAPPSGTGSPAEPSGRRHPLACARVSTFTLQMSGCGQMLSLHRQNGC